MIHSVIPSGPEHQLQGSWVLIINPVLHGRAANLWKRLSGRINRIRRTWMYRANVSCLLLIFSYTRMWYVPLGQSGLVIFKSFNLVDKTRTDTKISAVAIDIMTTQPWGTITKPPFELGYQKLNEDEIDSMVERLSRPKTAPKQEKKRPRPAIEKRELKKEEIKEVVARLAHKETNLPRTPDIRRVHRYKKEWGVVLNSYAWNGCNHQAILCGEESPWNCFNYNTKFSPARRQ